MSEETLLISKGSSIYNIFLDDVIYFESQLKQIKIIYRDSVLLYYDTIERLLSELDDNFIRCHRSYIVNLKKVFVITTDEKIFLWNK